MSSGGDDMKSIESRRSLRAVGWVVGGWIRTKSPVDAGVRTGDTLAGEVMPVCNEEPMGRKFDAKGSSSSCLKPVDTRHGPEGR